METEVCPKAWTEEKRFLHSSTPGCLGTAGPLQRESPGLAGMRLPCVCSPETPSGKSSPFAVEKPTVAGVFCPCSCGRNTLPFFFLRKVFHFLPGNPPAGGTREHQMLLRALKLNAPMSSSRKSGGHGSKPSRGPVGCRLAPPRPTGPARGDRRAFSSPLTNPHR